MTLPTRSQPDQDDLTALLTVIDTLEAFQVPDSRRQPDELAQRVRTLYRAQDLPLEEEALERAVALYADPAWRRPPTALPQPPTAMATPAPASSVSSSETETTFLRDLGFSAGLFFVLVAISLLGMVPSQAERDTSPTTLANHLAQVVNEPAQSGRLWIQSKAFQAQLRAHGMQAVATELPGGGTRLTLAHADPVVLRAMAASLQKASSAATPVNVRIPDQPVPDLDQISERPATVYIERPTSPP